MSTEFAFDLRLARRKAGLTQADCAHLLQVSQSRMSALECGQMLPSVVEICTLSIIYGRSFESLFEHILDDARRRLYARLGEMPPHRREDAATYHRSATLERLERRLAETLGDHDGP